MYKLQITFKQKQKTSGMTRKPWKSLTLGTEAWQTFKQKQKNFWNDTQTSEKSTLLGTEAWQKVPEICVSIITMLRTALESQTNYYHMEQLYHLPENVTTVLIIINHTNKLT
jgi:hypothetical protein